MSNGTEKKPFKVIPKKGKKSLAYSPLGLNPIRNIKIGRAEAKARKAQLPSKIQVALAKQSAKAAKVAAAKASLPFIGIPKRPKG